MMYAQNIVNQFAFFTLDCFLTQLNFDPVLPLETPEENRPGSTSPNASVRNWTTKGGEQANKVKVKIKYNIHKTWTMYPNNTTFDKYFSMIYSFDYLTRVLKQKFIFYLHQPGLSSKMFCLIRTTIINWSHNFYKSKWQGTLFYLESGSKIFLLLFCMLEHLKTLLSKLFFNRKDFCSNKNICMI
jgi:hypothetical protein